MFQRKLKATCEWIVTEWRSGPWFNINMSSYQYRKSHCGDKTVVRSSYLHNGICCTGKIISLYRIRFLFVVMKWIKITCKCSRKMYHPFWCGCLHLTEWYFRRQKKYLSNKKELRCLDPNIPNLMTNEKRIFQKHDISCTCTYALCKWSWSRDKIGPQKWNQNSSGVYEVTFARKSRYKSDTSCCFFMCFAERSEGQIELCLKSGGGLQGEKLIIPRHDGEKSCTDSKYLYNLWEISYSCGDRGIQKYL